MCPLLSFSLQEESSANSPLLFFFSLIYLFIRVFLNMQGDRGASLFFPMHTLSQEKIMMNGKRQRQRPGIARKLQKIKKRKSE